MLPGATVNAGVASFDDLSSWDMAIMAGHNSFTISEANLAKLKTYLDGGGVLFVDDCANSGGTSPFATSFDAMIYSMYGITDASMTVLPSTHKLFTSFYPLSGTDFSYTAAGNGTEWRQDPLVGYENHPQEINPIPAPSTMLFLGTGLGMIGLAAWRRRK